jgi:hypothetical protein
MAGLPNVQTGNPMLDTWCQLVEEQLNQLASQAGTATPSVLKLGQSTSGKDITPTAGLIYPDSLVKAWAVTSSAGVILGGFNLDCVQIATGQYRFTPRLKLTLDGSNYTTNYAVVANATGSNGDLRACNIQKLNGGANFDVYVYQGFCSAPPGPSTFSVTAVNDALHVIVLGPQNIAQTS